jgi:hypothetical protein
MDLPRCCNIGPEQGHFQILAIADFLKLRIKKDITLFEVPVLPGNAHSQLQKVPPQGFGKIPAALCGDFPAKPPSAPARFRYWFLGNRRVLKYRGQHFLPPLWFAGRGR